MKKLIFFSLCLLFAFSSISEGLTVESGWDLFVTQPGTNLAGFFGPGSEPFEGVPLGGFDFGTGLENVGSTDTIVERLGPAVVGGPGETATIDIEIVALQLRSVAPIDVGGGMVDFLYVTLQNQIPSMGTMDIKFDHQYGGTFDSLFDVFFDIRFGALSGPVIHSDFLLMTSSGNPWGRIAPSGATVIDGVNHNLKGDGTIEHDFWPGTLPDGTNPGPVVHDASGAGHHVVENPEPATICLLGLGGLLLRRKRCR